MGPQTYPGYKTYQTISKNMSCIHEILQNALVSNHNPSKDSKKPHEGRCSNLRQYATKYKTSINGKEVPSIDLFMKPGEMFKEIKTRYFKLNTYRTHIFSSEHAAKVLSGDDKVELYDGFFSREDKIRWFNDEVHGGYKSIKDELHHLREDTVTEARPDLQENYMERQRIIDILKKSWNDEWKMKALRTSNDRFTFQYLVLAMLLIIPYRVRRLDVFDTKFRNITVEDNAYLKEGGIQIRKCRGKNEKEVFLDFMGDEEMKEAIEELKKLREDQRKDHLFLTSEGEPATTESLFKSTTFKKKMVKFGLPPFMMENFRLSYCQHLLNIRITEAGQIRDWVGHGTLMHDTHYLVPTNNAPEDSEENTDGGESSGGDMNVDNVVD
ncbi:hypothetical protein HDV00_010702 [Rhizophlyctis rosea]|nr:hypothetical protein HDV00_010702 [Rhizophlyctis rosea]